MILMTIFFAIGVITGLALLFDGMNKDNLRQTVTGVMLIILLTLVFVGFCRIENLIAAALN